MWRRDPLLSQRTERDCAPSQASATDRNRDLPVLQRTRDAEFPRVSVRPRLSEAASTTALVLPDLDIQFAGQTAQYKQVPFPL